MDRILAIISDWDPIGLFPGAPKDEYLNEAKEIESILTNNPQITWQELANCIHNVFIIPFGVGTLEVKMEECLEIAKKILGN